MRSSLKPFDVSLAFPQWQGSGRPENLPRGAAAAAAICGRYAPQLSVPLWDHAARDDHGVRRWDAIFAQFRSAQTILARSGAKRVLTAGGDCAVDVAVIDHLNRIHPGLRVIWVDAHLDANTPATSPSGNFHGMPVSAILGRAPEPMRSLLGTPVDPVLFNYLGITVGDDGEWALKSDLKLKVLDPRSFGGGPVHVHFDLDALDPHEFPFVAYPDGGLGVEEAVDLLESIARQADVVGLTVTEFAPSDEDQAREGGRVIARLCEAVIES